MKLVLCTAGTAQEGGRLFDAQLLKPVLLSRLRAALAQLDVGPETGPAAKDVVPLAGCRVLLAEDNATSQMVARVLLERAGAEVAVVADGAAAVAALRQGGFDVVLMDMQMPGMDGLAATRAVRAGESGHHQRIIGLTAAAGAEYERQCLAAGMDAYLAKPVSNAALLQAIGKVPARILQNP
jgi:CheY-like chemotaxis protein